MTILEIQSAKLEDDRHQPPPPRIPSRKLNHVVDSTISTNGNILDQIKRSAGNTPVPYHHRFNLSGYHKNETEYELDMIRQNDTDNGYAGFGVSPFVGDIETYSFTTSTGGSLLPTGKGDGFNFLFDHKIEDKQDENINQSNLDDNLNHQKHPRKYTPLKSFLGPAERMFRILDAQQRTAISNEIERSSQQIMNTSPPTPSSTGSNNEENNWCDEEMIEFSEPMSLLDAEDEDDEDEDGTYSNSHTYHEETDEGSYYDSEDYDDDETFLTIDDEDYDEDDESKMQGRLTAVESFLDELAEVEDVRDLGSFLYQVGSCNFQSVADEAAEEEYTVNTDTLRTMSGTTPISQYQQHNNAENTYPQPYEIPPRVVSTSSSFIEGTTDTVAQILHSMSISTESLFDIMGSASHLHATNDRPGATSNHQTVPTETPTSAKRSFLQAMFSCHGG